MNETPLCSHQVHPKSKIQTHKKQQDTMKSEARRIFQCSMYRSQAQQRNKKNIYMMVTRGLSCFEVYKANLIYPYKPCLSIGPSNWAWIRKNMALTTQCA